MTIFTYDIKEFKFSVADDTQVRADFSRDYKHIFINDVSLEEIYKKMEITVNQENHLKKEQLLALWNEYCFIGANEEQLPYWKKFANTLFHQGGLLYAFEAALKEKMCLPENNSKVYVPEKIEKEVHISFDKRGLTIQEKCIFTEIKDPLEEDNLVAKEGSYLIKAKLTHHVNLIEKNGELSFQHVMVQPEYKCKNSELRKCLKQRELSIWEALKSIISKIFQLEFEPNRASFFQKPCYQSQINLNGGYGNLLKNHYTKITNQS